MKRYWVIAPYNSEKVETFNKVWEYDLRNGTIAVGWTEMGNLIGLSKEEIHKKYLEVYKADIPGDRHAIVKFYHEISIGDIVITRKGRKKIIGVGEVIATAFYDEDMGKERVGHRVDLSYPNFSRIGIGDNSLSEVSYGANRPYPNFLRVAWQEKIIEFDRQVFPMFTLYEISEDKYNFFMQGKSSENARTLDKIINKKINKPPETIYECPHWLEGLIKDIESLKKDEEHKERAHESLVESFYELLGFKKFNDIKHRQGRIDISVEHGGETIIVTEVKKDWNLSYKDKSTVIQAYNYSLESGARYVIITNGDYYAIFDKEKGRSYESNFLGVFKLSQPTEEGLKLIGILKKENIV